MNLNNQGHKHLTVLFAPGTPSVQCWCWPNVTWNFVNTTLEKNLTPIDALPSALSAQAQAFSVGEKLLFQGSGQWGQKKSVFVHIYGEHPVEENQRWKWLLLVLRYEAATSGATIHLSVKSQILFLLSRLFQNIRCVSSQLRTRLWRLFLILIQKQRKTEEGETTIRIPVGVRIIDIIRSIPGGCLQALRSVCLIECLIKRKLQAHTSICDFITVEEMPE